MALDPSAARSGSVSSDNPAYRGAWIAYIAGEYIPITAFSVTSGVWQIPAFTLTVAHDPMLLRLGHEDRVPAEIFYLDHWAYGRPTWCLMVSGEITGYTVGNAGITFRGQSNIAMLESLRFHYMSSVDDIVAAQAVENQAQGFLSSGMLYPYALFHQGLDPAGQTSPTENTTPDTTNAPGETDTVGESAYIKAPYEFLYNVIKGCISSRVPATRRSMPSMGFYAPHIRKTRLHNRFVRLPKLEDPERLETRRGAFPIFAAARSDAALQAIQRSTAQEVGNSGPVWSTIRTVLNQVWMEVGMIPNPACVRVSLAQDGVIVGRLAGTAALVTQESSRVTDATRRATELAEILRRSAGQNVSLDPALLTEAGLTVTPASAADIDEAAIRRHLLSRADVPEGHGTAVVTPTEPVRLAEYFVKPPLTFALAPHCNVVFPSMSERSSYSLDEDYMSQPTRVYVNDSVMTESLRASGPNAHFMLHALTAAYPEEAEALLHQHVGDGSGSSGTTTPTSSGRNFLLWPEENFKGIVQASYTVPRWLQHLRQFLNRQQNEGTVQDGTGVASAAATTTDSNGHPVITPVVAATSTTAATSTAPTSAAITGPTPEAVTNPTAIAPLLPGQPATAADLRNRPIIQRVLLDRGGLQLSINGEASSNYWVAANRGLDPRFLLPYTRTSLWPNPQRRGRNEARQRRGLVQSPQNPDVVLENDPRWAGLTAAGTLYRHQRRCQMIRLISSALEGIIEGASEIQRWATAFGFFWVARNEVAEGEAMHCWGFGNIRQYDQDPTGTPWFLEHRQTPPKPYVGGRTALEGATNVVRAYFRRDAYAEVMNLLLTGRIANNQLRRLVENHPEVRRCQAVFERLGSPIRPDLFYLGYGFYGLYGEHIETMSNSAESRTLLALRRISGLATSFETARRVWDAGAVPEDQITVTPETGLRSDITPEDMAFLLSRQNVGRSRFNTARQSTTIVARVGEGRVALPGAATREPATQSVGLGVGALNFARPRAVPGYTPPAASGRRTVVSEGDGPATTEEQPDEFRHIFRIYAQYEYYRRRYAARSMPLRMAFNPYIVAGFPVFVFDTMARRRHVVGYAQNVTQIGQVSNRSGVMTTEVGVTYARTFYEFVNDCRIDAERFQARVLAAPAEVIDEIREVVQDESQAEDFYAKLFHGGAPSGSRRASFRWLDAMGMAPLGPRQTLVTEAVELEGESVATVTAAPTTPEQGRTVSHTIDPNREYEPLPAYQPAFDQYDAAMRLVARPVCTLDEYIRFMHGGMTVSDAQARGFVGQARTDLSYGGEVINDAALERVNPTTEQSDTRGRVTTSQFATYYDSIYRLRPGPGDPPDAEHRGYTDPPNIQATTVNRGLPSNAPQTRADWAAVIRAYRDKIKTRVAPNT